MAYVAAKGGEQAILRAEQLHQLLGGTPSASLIREIELQLPYLIDRVMGEASLYAPELAALAVAQASGDLYEAVLMLRAYRSTQPRLAYAEIVESNDLLTIRRISAAFKEIPGGQILGPTLDYSHRILKLDLLEADQSQQESLQPYQAAPIPAPRSYPAVADWQRDHGLLDRLAQVTTGRDEPSAIPDLTREPVRFPASRAHRLQSLARADTGGVLALGYANMRGYGTIHPTVNELRLAMAEVQLRHPVTGALFSIGRVRLSSAEVVTTFSASTANPKPQSHPSLNLGYAATLGWNEVKVIAASMLDRAMDLPEPHPAHTEEFVLQHTEPVDASGFCIHYKLPHYVTFQSTLDAVRGVRDGGVLDSEPEPIETVEGNGRGEHEADRDQLSSVEEPS